MNSRERGRDCQSSVAEQEESVGLRGFWNCPECDAPHTWLITDHCSGCGWEAAPLLAGPFLHIERRTRRMRLADLVEDLGIWLCGVACRLARWVRS